MRSAGVEGASASRLVYNQRDKSRDASNKTCGGISVSNSYDRAVDMWSDGKLLIQCDTNVADGRGKGEAWKDGIYELL